MLYDKTDALPMKEPVLLMRLKKQLSGGRVPHLLQKKYSEKTFESVCEILFPIFSILWNKICRLSCICACWTQVGRNFDPSHPVVKCLTFHPINTSPFSRKRKRLCDQEARKHSAPVCFSKSPFCFKPLTSYLPECRVQYDYRARIPFQH